MEYQIHSIVANEDLPGPGSVVSLDPATEEEIATVSAFDAAGFAAGAAWPRLGTPAVLRS